MRIVFERKIPHDVTATLDYAFGGVLDLNGENISWNQVRGLLEEHNSHAMTAKVTGSLPGSHTKWIASYRWMNGAALTPVDMFNVSPGQADPYLNIFVRQPLPLSAPDSGKNGSGGGCSQPAGAGIHPDHDARTAARCSWCSRHVRFAAASRSPSNQEKFTVNSIL